MKTLCNLFLLLTFFLFPASTAAQGNASGLDKAIGLYKMGEYYKAVKDLKTLANIVKNPRNKASVYKYLAFSYVMMERSDKARDAFTEMIRLDPYMEVDTVANLPSITTVYKQVKLEQALEVAKKQEKNLKFQMQKRSRRAHTVYWLSSGLLGLGSGGVSLFFYTKGQQTYKDYKNSTDQDEILGFRDEIKNDYLVSQISLGVSGGLLAFAVYRFVVQPDQGSRTTFEWSNGGPKFALKF